MSNMTDIVGHYFNGHDGKTYLCESYDPSQGYWMTATDGSRRANVSERAINRTFHKIPHVKVHEDASKGANNG